MVARAADLLRRNIGSFSNLLIPRIEDVIFMAIFLSVVGLGSRLMNMDGDLGRHLTIGNYILDSFTIPTRDIFSHTMEGLPLTPHEWMAQLFFSLSYRIAGLDGPVILTALVIALTFTLVYKQCLTQSDSVIISMVMTILAASAASVHWLARPHIFTLLFVVLWIGQLEKFKRTGKIRLWALPVIMIVWVNFHGAFIAGFLIWGIYLVDFIISEKLGPGKEEQTQAENNHPLRSSKVKTLFVIGIIALCGTLVNPVGWRIWETTIGFLRNTYLVSHTLEYQPPDFHQVYFWPFLGMICLSILLLALQSKKLSISSMLLVTSWTAMGLISARNISIYAAATAPILAGITWGIMQNDRRLNPFSSLDGKLRSIDKFLPGYLWPAASFAVIAFLIMSGTKIDFRGDGNRFLESNFPVGAVNWVEEQGNLGPVFNHFPWGGYLLYRLWPSQKVFIDGQTDFYGEDLTRRYEAVITLQEDWQEILTRYQVAWVIMPTGSRLVQALTVEPNWEVRYQDDTATVLTRQIE